MNKRTFLKQIMFVGAAVATPSTVSNIALADVPPVIVPPNNKKKKNNGAAAKEKARKARCKATQRELTKCQREHEAARKKKLSKQDKVGLAEFRVEQSDADLKGAKFKLRQAEKALKSAEKDVRTGFWDNNSNGGKKAVRNAKNALAKAKKAFNRALTKSVNADEALSQLKDEIKELRGIQRDKLKRIRALERKLKSDKCT